MQLLKSTKLYLLILGLQLSHFGAFSQKPPTGGPNPSESTDIAPIIIAGGGLVLGAGSYLYFKNRGPKILLTEHLPSYLLNRNILPSPDALHLMYLLNPELNHLEVIRSKKKLVNPDFPEMSNNMAFSTGQTIPQLDLNSVGLNEQVKAFRANLNDLRKLEFNQKSADNYVNFDSSDLILNKLEETISDLDPNQEQGNRVKIQLIIDLMDVLNRTLWQTIDSKIMGERETVLIKEIMANLSELLSPDIPISLDAEKSSGIHDPNPLNDEVIFLASLKADPSSNTLSNTTDEKNSNLYKGFAFAVYKVEASGEIITKGPAVEGVFLVKYVSPALKDFQEAYHSLSPLATYASAQLPPAKLYFVVEDLKGNQVTVKEPLIDFKLAFKNLKQEKIDGLIVVPIMIIP